MLFYLNNDVQFIVLRRTFNFLVVLIALQVEGNILWCWEQMEVGIFS
jgi:hypothetical protein